MSIGARFMACAKIREQFDAGIDPAAAERMAESVNDDDQVTFEVVAREWPAAQVPSWDPKYADLVKHTLEG